MAAQPIAFDCTNCGHTLRVKPELAGKRGNCPSCEEPLTVPKARTSSAPQASVGPRYDTGEIIPTHLEHLQIRIPLFARELQRKQDRMGEYLTQEEAHHYVRNLYKEQALRVFTLVVMALLALSVLTLLSEGVVGTLIAVGKQVAWAAPMSAFLYFLGQYLLVPPIERTDTPDNTSVKA